MITMQTGSTKFWEKYQNLIAKKDIQGIYKNVLIDELQNGCATIL